MGLLNRAGWPGIYCSPRKWFSYLSFAGDLYRHSLPHWGGHLLDFHGAPVALCLTWTTLLSPEVTFLDCLSLILTWDHVFDLVTITARL